LEGYGKQSHSTCFVWIESFVLFSYENLVTLAHNTHDNHSALIYLLNANQSEPFKCSHKFKKFILICNLKKNKA
jgi:hypothetical protein